MQDEMTMLESLRTWSLTPLPPYISQAIGVKWVYHRKWSGDGYNIDKARLVAKGSSQREGEDFAETYAPVSNMITVRCLLAMVAARGLYLWQLDIKNAFLHGVIDRELYVNQLEGFSDGSGRKLWLHKSLYGLKQSPRCWYGALEATLTQFDFCRCPAEPALFYRDVFVEGGAGSISRNWVAVYVDDILFAADNEHLLQQTYLSLNSKFILKRIDPIDAYLGVEICYSPSSCQLLIHQQRYVEQATLDLGDGSPVTPLTYNLRLD